MESVELRVVPGRCDVGIHRQLARELLELATNARIEAVRHAPVDERDRKRVRAAESGDRAEHGPDWKRASAEHSQAIADLPPRAEFEAARERRKWNRQRRE